MKVQTTFNQIREKEIINTLDGKRLGRIIDIVFETDTTKVSGIIVPAPKKFFSFRRPDDVFISLENVKKIGDDVILVELVSNNPPIKKKNGKDLVDVVNYSPFERESQQKQDK